MMTEISVMYGSEKVKYYCFKLYNIWKNEHYIVC